MEPHILLFFFTKQLTVQNESQTPNCASSEKKSGFGLSNRNIVTRLISSVVPEGQRNKHVNSVRQGDTEFAVSLCVSSSGYQRDVFTSRPHL